MGGGAGQPGAYMSGVFAAEPPPPAPCRSSRVSVGSGFDVAGSSDQSGGGIGVAATREEVKEERKRSCLGSSHLSFLRGACN